MNESEIGKIEVFIDTSMNIGGYTLRPYTADSLLLLMYTKNGFVQPTREEHETLYHVAAFIYLHVEELSKIYAVVKKPDEFFAAVNDFCQTLTQQALLDAIPLVQKIISDGVVGQDYKIESTEGSDPN